jgi:hypothetical protein
MASLPSTDLTEFLATASVEVIEDAARRQMSASMAELEAYRLAVAHVRQACKEEGAGDASGWLVARNILDLLSDLP